MKVADFATVFEGTPLEAEATLVLLNARRAIANKGSPRDKTGNQLVGRYRQLVMSESDSLSLVNSQATDSRRQSDGDVPV